MIESWLQWTCDGCGDTAFTNIPNQTRKELLKMMKDDGWKRRGRLDYCPTCVKEGRAKRRETILDVVG